MGVDVFFVISGYLMTLTIWKGIQGIGALPTYPQGKFKASINFLLSFYAKRIKRLAPAATVLLIAVLIAVYMMGNFSLQLSTAPQVFASATFVQNWFLAAQAVDYLGADAGATAVQHFWSLSVEEQFYMIWPLLILVVGLIVFAIDRRRTTEPRPSMLPLIVISAFTLASLIYGIYLTNTNPVLAYFITPARIWELSLGGIIVFLPKIKSYDLRLLLPWAGLALIAYTFVQWGGADFPGIKALIPTAATALIIWGGGGGSSAPSSSKTNSRFSVANISRLRPAQFFGDISYSLYLWHWPLIILVPFYLGVDLNNNNSKLKVAIFLASIALAALSYFLVEKPTRKLGTQSANKATPSLARKRYGNSRSVAATWVTGALCLAAILIPAHIIEARAADYTQNIVVKAFERAMDPNDIGFGARAITHKGEAGVPENPFGEIDVNYSSVATETVHGIYDAPDTKGIGGYDTFTTSTQPTDIKGEFGDLTSDKTIVVLGDSHSMQWYGAIDIAARNLGYKVVSAGTWHAAGGLYELTYEFGDTWPHWQGQPLSVKRANDRFNWIKDNLWSEADIVIVGTSNGYHIKDPANTDPEYTLDAPEKIASTFRELKSITGNNVILIQDNPFISDYSMTESTADFEWPANESEINALYNRLAAVGAADTFSYLETKPLFVDNDGNAHTWIGGVPVYYDQNHINTLYSASCGEYFTEQLRALGL